MTLTSTRAALAADIATALAGHPHKVHSAPPTDIKAPAVVIVPSEPWVELQDTQTVLGALRANWEVNIVVSGSVRNRDASADLESTITDLLTRIPDNWWITEVSAPWVGAYGQAQYLIVTLRISNAL